MTQVTQLENAANFTRPIRIRAAGGLIICACLEDNRQGRTQGRAASVVSSVA
jgi:hypothetical protein